MIRIIKSIVSKLSREVTWVALSQATSVIGSLAVLRLLTEAMAPALYGELTLALISSAAASLIIYGPLGAGLSRLFPIAQAQDQMSNMLCGISNLFAASIAITLCVIFFLTYLSHVTDSPISGPLLLAIAAHSAASGLSFLTQSIQNAARARKLVSIQTIIEVSLRATLCAIAISVESATPTLIISGYAIAAFISAIFQIYNIDKIQRMRQWNISAEWARKIFSLSWPFAITGVFTFAHQSSDRWCLELFSTRDVVGQYAVALAVSTLPITLIVSFLNVLITPIFYSIAGDGADADRQRKASRLLWRVTITFAIFSFSLGALSIFFHRQLFTLLVGEEFTEFSWMIPILITGAGLFHSGQLLSMHCMIYMRANDLLLPRVGSCLIGIMINFVMIDLGGAGGAAIANVLFGAGYFVWVMLISRSGKQPSQRG
jgi:O-antigen/teichoic acid export membrane protein